MTISLHPKKYKCWDCISENRPHSLKEVSDVAKKFVRKFWRCLPCNVEGETGIIVNKVNV